MSKKKNKRPTKLHVKKGDVVIVISGRSKGKEGEVLEVHPADQRAIVDGVNPIIRHIPNRQAQDGTQIEGGRIEAFAPIHISNLMHKDPNTGERTRIGRKLVDGKLVRYSKKSGEIIS